MEAVTRMATRQQADTLASAAAGDEIAFQHIIDTHHEDLRRVCQAISGEPGGSTNLNRTMRQSIAANQIANPIATRRTARRSKGFACPD